MNLSEDISKEELAVFLEETDGQLKLLADNLILLEKSGVKSEIMQEIFRAAHNLKGSSAMLGLEKMSHVAHAIETALDRVRRGDVQVSTQLIDTLLGALDILKQLREMLVSNEDSGRIDIEPLRVRLEKLALNEINSHEYLHNEFSWGAETLRKIKSAQEKGCTAYSMRIGIDQKSSWMAVRQFQIITELSTLGEVLDSNPTRNDIESGKVGNLLELIFIGSCSLPNVKNAINSVPDLFSLEVNLLDPIDEAIYFKAKDSSTDLEIVTKKDEEGKSAPKTCQNAETVRVDVKVLDKLMNLVGEVVIDRNRIRQISRELLKKYGGDENVGMLGETSGHMVKLVSDLQDNILRARMVQIGTILNGFPRLVRDLSQKSNKIIDFIIEGQETEVDRSIIEQIKDPLLHLLRNAVDHGIEPAEKRKAAGKPETGTIRLSAYHEQSHIIVSVSDDGGGIDVEKVKSTAVKKGFMSSEEVGRLSVGDAQNLIFTSGLSTAEKITEVSGRGVGMDVVKTNVTNLGGSISIDSKLGYGTTIALRLPLTLATIDGILVSSGGLIYVIPISAIVEILRVNKDEIQCLMGKEVFRLRENVIPVVRLNQRFEQKTDQNVISDLINIVVIKVGNKLSGLVVDSVLEPQESVVKSLGKYIGSLPGISGATIMGDGKVALILDTATLIKNC